MTRLERRLLAVETQLTREPNTRARFATPCPAVTIGDTTGSEIQRIRDELNDAQCRVNAAVALGNERDRKLAARPHAVADPDALDNEINFRVGEIVELQPADPAEYLDETLGAQPRSRNPSSASGRFLYPSATNSGDKSGLGADSRCLPSSRSSVATLARSITNRPDGVWRSQ